MISKVCRLAWDYPVRGESTYGLQPVFVKLSEEQVRQGHEVHVIAAREPSQPAEEVCNGVQIHRVPSPYSIGSLKLIRKLIGSEKDWVVHSHATCGFYLFSMEYMRRFPLVCHVHGTSRSHHTPLSISSGGKLTVSYSSWSVNYHMIRERLLWSSAERVLAVSKSSATDLTDVYKIPTDSVRVVYNGVDADEFLPTKHPSPPKALSGLEDKKVILFVGHFGLRKGIFYLIRALSIIRQAVPEAHLVCIGGAPKWLGGEDFWGVLHREIEANSVKDNVTLLEAVRSSDLAQFYAYAEVFALPSYYETFSKVCVEAMSCGKPVVATRAGGIPEVVEESVTGLLIDYGSVPQLASSIISLLQDEKTARRMGTRGRERVLKMFTWKAVADRIEDVYKEIA